MQAALLPGAASPLLSPARCQVCGLKLIKLPKMRAARSLPGSMPWQMRQCGGRFTTGIGRNRERSLINCINNSNRDEGSTNEHRSASYSVLQLMQRAVSTSVVLCLAMGISLNLPGAASARTDSSTSSNAATGTTAVQDDGGASKGSARISEGVAGAKHDWEHYVADYEKELLEKYPELEGTNILERKLRPSLGVPMTFEEVMQSMVYDPTQVPPRYDKGRWLMDVTARHEDVREAEWKAKYGKDWKAGFEHELLVKLEDDDFIYPSDDGEVQLFRTIYKGLSQAEEAAIRNFQKKDHEWVPPHIRMEVMMREALKKLEPQEAADPYVDSADLLSYEVEQHPERFALKTAAHSFMHELSYTQFWYLIGEGSVDKVRYYGPERRAMMVTLRASAPGGARTCKVVVPPDPELFDHMIEHGVVVDLGMSESDRVGKAWMIQILRYVFPFFIFSWVCWLVSTLFLESSYHGRRKWMVEEQIAAWEAEQGFSTEYNLQFDTPIRPIEVNPEDVDFIAWDEIHGIDSVKREIEEAIAFLKNPRKLMSLGIRKIGGILLAGAPGTGKTLLAKALSNEADVPMFGCSGTDFQEMYVGMGASKIRKTFELLKSVAPCILFIDEFDALGMARGSDKEGSMGDEESVNTINELLTQMDGFEPNKAVLILAATNRPGVLDEALTRPGRFDRVVYMPLPDVRGRAQIMQVHAMRRPHDFNINWYELARAVPGYTGADIMGLMNRSSRMAARAGHDEVKEDDVYAAIEYGALVQQDELMDANIINDPTPEPIPMSLKKSIAVYQAGKALLGYITPEFEKLGRVSCCPYGVVTGYTLFIEDEDKSANTIVMRGDMESHLVVNLAGRCAEKLVMGESEVTGQGAPDIFQANLIAREMILACGMGRKTGPISLMEHVVPQADRDYTSAAPGDDDSYIHMSDMSTEMARTAFAEVIELLEAAEAKAYYGIAINWKPLNALVDALLVNGVMSGKDVAEVLEKNGVIHFPDPYTEGFGWDDKGTLDYPFKPTAAPEEQADIPVAKEPELVGLAAKTWYAGTEYDVPRDENGKFKFNWHWNSPYSVRKDLPDWFKKEVERYSY